MIVPKTMIANHVTNEAMGIKKQQQEPIQWVVPSKIKNFLNGSDGVGSTSE